MSVNKNKTDQWKADVKRSVDFYNDWFMRFAPQTYRDTRTETTRDVERALEQTANLTSITPDVLRQHPGVLATLRMSTAPPIAQDRLVGLAGISKNLVNNMEKKNRVPPRMSVREIDEQLQRIGDIVMRLADEDLFTWLDGEKEPTHEEVHRAATIVADRLTGARADPIIRNAQEKRQLAAIQDWLLAREYTLVEKGVRFDGMEPGTFGFRMNIPATQASGTKQVNIPVDAVIMPQSAERGELPLLVEAKSAGDFTNTNKRQKEEATKIAQLRKTFGEGVRYILFLNGYFDAGYLGYEAAEGIDWVWEHRIDDLAAFNL